MSAIKLSILLLFIIYFSFLGFSQKESFSPNHLRKMAHTAEELGDIYTAIDLYKNFLDLKPQNTKITFRLAECYRKARDYENASILYKKVCNINPKKYGVAYFYYGQMLIQEGKYTEAKQVLLKNKKTLRALKIKNKKYFKKMYKSILYSCDLAPILKDSILKVIIYHLDTSVNGAHIEASPLSLTNDTFLYSSLKNNKIEYYNLDDTLAKIPVRKFYIATRKNAKWKTIGEFHPLFNDSNTNVANGSFSPDGNRFYFTKTTINKANKIISQIYISIKSNEKWSVPKRLAEPINDPFYTSTQPTVGIESKKNLEVVYFVTDRPKGKGGTDIWYFLYDKNNDKYSKPRKAGRKINTVGNEITPYFDIETHTLYFSSDGYPGLGGLDVFKTTGELSRWDTPVNIGYPINTEADDLYFTISKNRETGFFTSNRKGGIALKNPTCCDDLYNFRWTQYIHISIKGTIFGKDTTNSKSNIIRLSDSTKITLLLLDTNNNQKTNFIINTVNINPDGTFNFNLERNKKYQLLVEKNGYFNGIANFSTNNINNSDTLIQDVTLKKISKHSIILKNIYYEFDKARLTKIAIKNIDSLLYPILRDNPKLIVEISSHTDSKGDENYNKRLSQKRAESVVNYLIKKKRISTKRLVAKGYGELKPIATNTKRDGSDNPKGRTMNRRTEFKIIGSSNLFSKINYDTPIKKN